MPYYLIAGFVAVLWLMQPSKKEVKAREQAAECMDQVRSRISPPTACY